MLHDIDLFEHKLDEFDSMTPEERRECLNMTDEEISKEAKAEIMIGLGY